MNNGGILVNMVSLVSDIWAVIESSVTFSILKGFLALYVLFLVADIIMLLMLRPITGDLKKAFYGTKEHAFSSGSALRKRWQEIERHLSSARSADWKIAVLQADDFLGMILREMGYEGDGTGASLERIQSGEFVSLPGIREAHEIRNRIVLEESLSLQHEEANRIVSLYRAFLSEAEVLQ